MENKMEVLNWKQMAGQIENMSEAELKAYLLYEVSTHKRKSYMIRLHQRFGKLRDQREREALLRGELI